VGTYLRRTPALRDVVRCLAEAEAEVWGLLIAARSGRPTGTVYPLLERLEREGFVRSRWEADGARSGARRRLYTLTVQGAAWAIDQVIIPAGATNRKEKR